MKLMRLGIDLAKNVFQLHGVDRQEKPILRKQLKRGQLLNWIKENLDPSCEIAMEACSSAHDWARKLMAQGFTIKLIAPQHVKPYVKTNKNDARDAEAICEAMSRPSMRFVTVKTADQQAMQATHRIRAELVKERTAKANQIRGLCAEFGLAAPVRIEHLRQAIPLWLEDAENELPVRFRKNLSRLREDLQYLDQRIKEQDQEILEIARQDEIAQRLQSIPGIGPVTATALSMAVGDGRQFKNGRDMAVWIGLTPKHTGTGGKEKMLGISKRGDAYLRTLLIHGARAVVRTCANKTDRISCWVKGLVQRRHPNVAAVALANKNARIAWAIIQSAGGYDPQHSPCRPSGKPLAPQGV